MVNYCCVEGCGRNSRLHSHLKYYSLPKEKLRQVQWLKAAGREDLLEKGKDRLTISHRFCSRHFPPASLKNIHLQDDAVPTLNLPGICYDDDANSSKPEIHKGITCDNCNNVIHGFRYKCVTCKNFDLCQKCEMQEVHAKHYMLRMPKTLKFKTADNLGKKWQKIFKEEHIAPMCDSDSDGIKEESSSDDDQPINKYIKNYDSGIDLSDDIKVQIRKEVIRALSVSNDDDDDFFKPSNPAKPEKKKNERKRTVEEKSDCDSKKQKIDTVTVEIEELLAKPPELAFADVNDMKDMSLDVKPELQNTETYPLQTPLMHVKLSDDLTHLTIEMMGDS